MTCPAVYAAISSVQGALAKQGIAKNQTNTFDKYKFRGIDDVLNALGPELAAAGLLILPQYDEPKMSTRQSKSGGDMIHVLISAHIDFIAVADGSKHTITAWGEAIDRGDKAIPKAMAACYKYALLQALCVPIEAMPDADQESHHAITTITLDQAKNLADRLATDGIDEAKFCEHFKIDTLAQMPSSTYQVALATIDRRQKRRDQNGQG